jgi:hypothetical protein
MGFFKKLLFGEEKEKTKIEQQVEEHADSYAQAQVENIAICNGCGQEILGKPRIRNHNGKVLYFHKKCWKAMCNGKLPIPQKN